MMILQLDLRLFQAEAPACPLKIIMCRTLSLKQCRKLLEKDLGLSEKALDAHKALVGELVEKVIFLKAATLLVH